MLFSLKDMQKMTLRTPDGDLGVSKTILVDIFEWFVRYAIVEAGGRQVPLSVRAVGQPNFRERVLPVNLSLDRIMNSPQIDMTRPFTRESERQISDYYEWPYYWDPSDVPNTLPGDLTAVPLIELELDREQQEQEMIPETGSTPTGRERSHQRARSHLRDVKDLFGMTVHATNDDQNAGKLDDLVVMDDNWSIPYMVIDTGGLLSTGRKVVIAPSFVEQVTGSRIDINLRSDTIKGSPGYSSIEELTDEFQSRLRDYYGR